jgi:hypothetical protein
LGTWSSSPVAGSKEARTQAWTKISGLRPFQYELVAVSVWLPLESRSTKLSPDSLDTVNTVSINDGSSADHAVMPACTDGRSWGMDSSGMGG